MSATIEMDTFSSLPPIAELLRRVWPRHTRKHVAATANVQASTAKSWIDGRTCPNADAMLRLAKHAEVRRELKKILEELDFAERRIAEGVCKRVAVPGGEVRQADQVDVPVSGSARRDDVK